MAVSTFLRSDFVRRFLWEWCIVLFVVSLALAALLRTQAVQLTNYYAYDRLLSAHERVPDDRIIIIGIDDVSLKELGRWPWSRQVHGQLIDRLLAMQPRGVLLDVVFTEPALDGSDERLAASLERFSAANGTVVALPMLLQAYAGEKPTAILPVESLRAHALLGQIVVSSDIDGVVRRVQLSREDADGQDWPLLTTQLVNQPPLRQNLPETMLIPFNVAKGGYPVIPYASVLNGQLPPDFLKDKYVLIGATASGLGDQFTTPSSGSDGTVAGVEIHANILDALLNNLAVETFDSDWARFLAVILPMMVLMLCFLWLDERFHLAAFLLVVAFYTLVVLAFLWFKSFWLYPALGWLGILMAYVLWSWRRLVVVLRYVKDELTNAQRNTGKLPSLLTPERSNLFLPSSLERGMQQIHQLYQFTGNSLAYLPTALVVVDAQGEILIANYKARESLALRERTLAQLLQRLDPDEVVTVDGQGVWLNALQGVELQSESSQVYQLYVTQVALTDDGKTAAVPNTLGKNSVWLVNFLNLSNECLMQRERGELIEFLSHDLRSPQVSILSLIELQRQLTSRVDDEVFYSQIADKVHQTLDWAADLVELSKIKVNQYQMNELNAAQILDEAIEHVWAQAQAKCIELTFDEADRLAAESIWVLGDGALLIRALVNLLSNAIRYSESDNAVRVSVCTEGSNPQWFICRIIDGGRGMSNEQLARLNLGLQPIPHTQGTQPDAASSLGVGFAMARTVIMRHQGHLVVESELGRGTTVIVRLPISLTE